MLALFPRVAMRVCCEERVIIVLRGQCGFLAWSGVGDFCDHFFSRS